MGNRRQPVKSVKRVFERYTTAAKGEPWSIAGVPEGTARIRERVVQSKYDPAEEDRKHAEERV